MIYIGDDGELHYRDEGKKDQGHLCRDCDTVIYGRFKYCGRCRQERIKYAQNRYYMKPIRVCCVCGRKSKTEICTECAKQQKEEQRLMNTMSRHPTARLCPACGKKSCFFDDGENLCYDCYLRKTRSRQPVAGKSPTESICWYCRNAVPKIVNGRYVAGCPWSVRHKPVTGWEAEMRNLSGNKKESWLVKACPGFVRE